MKLCCVPGCSVGYELGVHVALRPLRQSVYIACDVSVRLLSQRVSCYVASIIVLSLIPRLSCVGAGRKEPGTHCLRMLSYPRISGNLEISHKTCSVTLTSARTPVSLVYKLPATDYTVCGR